MDEHEHEDSTAANIEDITRDITDITKADSGGIALSPERNLLVSNANGNSVYELVIDWDHLKILKSRKIIPEEGEAKRNFTAMLFSGF